MSIFLYEWKIELGSYFVSNSPAFAVFFSGERGAEFMEAHRGEPLCPFD
ncbi:MAG: hypothetical protein KGL39_43645 [Patescibacteria group bacterium]|nr:hypothetical protein [Patescibacteria group bacterium]